LEDVMHVINKEKPLGVIVQFGGQTAINLAEGLENRGVKILGTSLEAINRAEDRHQFEALLEKLSLRRPIGKTVTKSEEAIKVASDIGYPVLVRPSYVIGGSRMEIVYEESELHTYIEKYPDINEGEPLLIVQYDTGKDIIINAIIDGIITIIPLFIS